MHRRIDRRHFIGTASLATMAACLTEESPEANHPENQTNIVLIMADDLGYECLGSYGGTSYATPRLDQLAASGVRFDHCYSQPLCSPSRVQIMTGQYNFRNYQRWAFLDPGEITFGNVLKEAGFKTCFAGKWQLGEDPTLPSKFGFDTFCVWQLFVEGMGSRYADPTVHIDGKRRVFEGGYGPDVFTNFVCDFIEEHSEEPFFVYYPMVLPHPPYQPTPDSDTSENPDKQEIFADMVAYIDRNVGLIVDKLEELNLRSNTLLLFTADNGTNTDIVSQVDGEKIQGGKALVTDAGTHVPLIANWPGTAEEGSVCEDLIDFTDFLPTLADAGQAGLPKDTVIDGRSFLPQIKGERGSPREWLFAYYEPRFPWREYGTTLFIRTQRWKLYDNGAFFDLEKDPLEKNPLQKEDLSREAKKIRAELEQALDSIKSKEALKKRLKTAE